jgi:hypothetical protein
VDRGLPLASPRLVHRTELLAAGTTDAVRAALVEALA